MRTLYLKHSPKGRKVEDIRRLLCQAPKQRPNSSEAFDHQVFEVSLEPGANQRAGTLAEVQAWARSRSDRYEIMCDDGRLVVECDNEGLFVEV